MRTTDTHVYFWGNSIYSNWDNAHFTDSFSTIRFQNTEQAFMWYKADFFEDEDTKKKIENTTNPKEVKELGRRVKNYDDFKWGAVRFDKMVYVNYLKFSQNPYYYLTLKNTGHRIIVEASPYDKIWGVGLSENDERILDEKNWMGTNLLGKALMEVRNQLSELLNR